MFHFGKRGVAVWARKEEGPIVYLVTKVAGENGENFKDVWEGELMRCGD